MGGGSSTYGKGWTSMEMGGGEGEGGAVPQTTIFSSMSAPKHLAKVVEPQVLSYHSFFLELYCFTYGNEKFQMTSTTSIVIDCASQQ